MSANDDTEEPPVVVGSPVESVASPMPVDPPFMGEKAPGDRGNTVPPSGVSFMLERSDSDGDLGSEPESVIPDVSRRILKEEIEFLTNNVIGNYTEHEIKKFRDLQRRLDNFHYTPIIAEQVLSIDDGWRDDPLFQFQSNYPMIMKILRERFLRENEEDDIGAMTADAERHKREQMEQFKIDAVNNSAVNEDRQKLFQLQEYLETTSVANKNGDEELVDAFDKFEGLFIPDVLEELEAIGPPERQIETYQRLLKVRKRQTNTLRSIADFLQRKVQRCIAMMSTMSPTLTSPVSSSNTEEVNTLRQEISDLKREQVYLYYRLYGPPVQKSAKAEKQKKYQKEVDSSYKQMVDADVAKKVAKAVNKKGDAIVKKVSEEVDTYKGMMMKVHLKMVSNSALGKMAFVANRQHEKNGLLAEDAQEIVNRVAKARKGIELSAFAASRSRAASSFTSEHTLSGQLDAGPTVYDRVVEVVSAVDEKIKAAVEGTAAFLADVAASEKMDEVAMRSKTVAISNIGEALKSAVYETAASTLSVVGGLPPSVGADVADSLQQSLVESLGESAISAINSFARSVCDAKDPHRLFSRVVGTMRAYGNYLSPRSGGSGAPKEDGSTQTKIRLSDIPAMLKAGGGGAGGRAGSSVSSRSGIRPSRKDTDSMSASGIGISPSGSMRSQKHLGVTESSPRRQASTLSTRSTSSQKSPGGHRSSPRSESPRSTSPGTSPQQQHGRYESPSKTASKASLRGDRPRGTTSFRSTTGGGTNSPRASSMYRAGSERRQGGRSPAPDGDGDHVVFKEGEFLPGANDIEPAPHERRSTFGRSVSFTSRETGSYGRRDSHMSNASDVYTDDGSTTSSVFQGALRMGGAGAIMVRDVGTNTPSKRTRQAFCQVTLLDSGKSKSRRGSLGSQSVTEVEAMTSSQDLIVPKDLPSRPRRMSHRLGPDAFVNSGFAEVSSEGSPSQSHRGSMLSESGITIAPTRAFSVGGGSDSAGPLGETRPKTPPPVLPTTGPLAFVFVGIDNAHGFWEKCPRQMPQVLRLLVEVMRDALDMCEGHEVRSEGDAFMAVFKTVSAAAQWALVVQHNAMHIPYPREILSQPQGIEMPSPAGQYTWRGFRLRMGIGIGDPEVRMRSSPFPGYPATVSYEGKDVTMAARLAVLACGGQVLVSEEAATILKGEGEALVNMAIRSQGEVPGLNKAVPVFDLVDTITVGRQLSPGNSVEIPVTGGILYQWLCSFASRHDFDVYDRLAFCFVEVQNETHFPSYSPEAVSSSTAMILREIRRLCEKNQGTVVREGTARALLSFEDVNKAAHFSMSVQSRTLQAPFPPEVLAIPDCRERFEDNFVCWRGLRVRLAMHYCRPDSVKVNQFTKHIDYFGKELAFGATVGGLTPHGDSVMTEAFNSELTLTGVLENGVVDDLGEVDVDSRTIRLFGVLPRALAARRRALALRETPERFFQDHELVSDLSATKQAMFELGDTTHVLSCTVDRAFELQQEVPDDFVSAINTFLDLFRQELSANGGHESGFTAATAQALFQHPEQAVRTAIMLQEKLMYASFPSEVLRVCGETLGETSNDVIFRGLRISMAVHCGKLHELQPHSSFGAAYQGAKTYYGGALTQAHFLSDGFSCGGETLLSEDTVVELQSRNDATHFLDKLQVYRIENVLLPGEHKRTGLFGVSSNILAARRRHFYRAKKAGVLQNVAATALTPGESVHAMTSSLSTDEAMIRRRLNKLTLDPYGKVVERNKSGGAAASGAGDFLTSMASGSSFTGSPSRNAMITNFEFEDDPHRCNGQILQRVYRATWRLAGKAGRTMGYPVSVDPDPVMFDAELREAIVSNFNGNELDTVLFGAENSVLLRVEEMLVDAALALQCTHERGTYFHRGNQTAIIIPPDDANESSLYKPVDVGSGKTVVVARGNAAVAGSGGGPSLIERIRNQAQILNDKVADLKGFRPGLGAQSADRLKERQLIELESQLGDLQNKLEGLSQEGRSLVVKSDAALQTIDELPLSSPALSRLHTPALRSRDCSNLHSAEVTLHRKASPMLLTEPQHRLAVTKRPGSLKNQPPLATLQVSYEPDEAPSDHLLLMGEPTSDNSLVAPFSNKQTDRGVSEEFGLPPRRSVHSRHEPRQAKPRERKYKSRTLSANNATARPGTLPFYEQRRGPPLQMGRLPGRALTSQERKTPVGDPGDDHFPMPAPGSEDPSIGAPSVDFVD